MKNTIRNKSLRILMSLVIGLAAQAVPARPTAAKAKPDTTRSVIPFANGVKVKLERTGQGRPVLVIHGGGGPGSVAGFVKGLSATADVLAPVIPGFSGTERPDWYNSIDDVALTYLELIEKLDLKDVLVVGFSMGGWVAAQMSVLDGHRIGGVVLVDALGIQVEGETVLDVFRINPADLPKYAFYNPAAFAVDPSKVTPEQTAERAANFATLAAYSKDRLWDTKLRRRLAEVETPALVVWGEADGIVTPGFGRAYAEAFAHGRFELISQSGHNPQLEQPVKLMGLVKGFHAGIANPLRIRTGSIDSAPEGISLRRGIGHAALSLSAPKHVSLSLVSPSGRFLADIAILGLIPFSRL